MTTNKVDTLDEVGENFLVYATDTNNNKSFPDARDGLKPGQRACLWSMYKAGFTSAKPHVKSAKIDGLVAANYWPHGTTAIYETFARMSQPFSNNNPEVDFHGANGNVIIGGDAIAADRYSEARLSPIAEEGMLQNINKNVVDMIPNFSEDEEWPKVLPALFPRLLVNGAQGIGVGIATEWALHNLQETADVLINYIRTGEVDNDNYYPDFPTGATIVNKNDLSQINKTGRGKVIVEAKYLIDKQDINFTEFPFQVYIEPIIEKIKEGIDTGKLIGIKEVNNKSDKKRILLTVTCAASANPQDILNQLFQYTPLRNQYDINQMAIISKTPSLLTLKDMCEIYTKHNIECIQRQYRHDLDKTLDRIEILEGLERAYKGIDNVINLIRNSNSSAEAKEYMVNNLGLTERQADAILGLKLSRLAHLEEQEILNELEQKRKDATEIQEILDSSDRQKKLLIKNLKTFAKKYSAQRRTQVIQKEIVAFQKTKKEKAVESVVVCYTDNGYIKSIPAAKYRPASGNLGCIETTTDGYIQIYNTKKVYRLKVSNIKQCLASEKGTALGTILGTGLTHIRMIATCGEDKDVVAVSKSGRIKKFNTSLFNGTTQNIKGQDYFPKNEVLFVITSEDKYLTFNSVEGYELCSDISALKASGKASTGRVGIKLGKEDSVFSIQTSKKPTEHLATLGTKGKNVGCVPH